MLTNISLYWFTQTAASSARIYYESRHAAPSASAGRPVARVAVPVMRGVTRGVAIMVWLEQLLAMIGGSSQAPDAIGAESPSESGRMTAHG